MRQLTFCALIIFNLASCSGTSSESFTDGEKNNKTPPPNIPRYYGTACGIKLINDGPRGGVFVDSAGRNFGYRVFRVQLMNDTTVPVELNVEFPEKPTELQPTSGKYLSAFLFPNTVTPKGLLEAYNFGVSNIDSFLRAGRKSPQTIKTIIEPKRSCVMYIGTLLSADGVGGLARAEVFFDGQEPDEPFLPVKPPHKELSGKSELGLVFGIGIDPPAYHALIPCGRVSFRQK